MCLSLRNVWFANGSHSKERFPIPLARVPSMCRRVVLILVVARAPVGLSHRKAQVTDPWLVGSPLLEGLANMLK